MSRLIDEITDDIIEISEEVSTEYEITSILKKHPTDTVIFTNIKDSNMNIISGICNTRDKIAKSMICRMWSQRTHKSNRKSNKNNKY